MIQAPTINRPAAWAVRGINFVLFQAAWFAAVISAAHGIPILGATAIVVVVAIHLALAARPVEEVKLLVASLAIGVIFETLIVRLHLLRFTSGQLVASLPAYWMVLMWGLLASTLNVTLRWLKPHRVLTALVGAIAGPASYAAGVRLGALSFVDSKTALIVLAVGWALLLPLLAELSKQFDGIGNDA